MQILDKLIEWIIKLLTFMSVSRKAKLNRVVDFIDKCVEHMKTILYQNNEDVEQVEFSRKWLQQAHQDIFDIVGSLVNASECDILRNSIVSARVFHHAVQYGKVDDERIKFDYSERFVRYTNGSYDQQRFRQNSNEVVLKKLVFDGLVINEEIRKHVLENLKDVCEEDVARVSILKEKIKTRICLPF